MFRKRNSMSLLREAQMRDSEDDGATSVHDPCSETTSVRNQIDVTQRRLFLKLFIGLTLLGVLIVGVALLLTN